MSVNATSGRDNWLDATQIGADVDDACDRFEAAWRAGLRPEIEDFLVEATDPGYPVRLRYLLAVELDYRRSLGETPDSSGYRRRFPGHEGLIDGSSRGSPGGSSPRPRRTWRPSTCPPDGTGRVRRTSRARRRTPSRTSRAARSCPSWAAAGWGSSTRPARSGSTAFAPEDRPARQAYRRRGPPASWRRPRPSPGSGTPTSCRSTTSASTRAWPTSRWSTSKGAASPDGSTALPGHPSPRSGWSRPGPRHRGCPSPGDRPPRPQAGQRPAQGRRDPQARRLRPGQVARIRLEPDAVGGLHRDPELRGPRAGRRPVGRPGGRHLRAGGDLVSHADRPAPLPGGDGLPDAGPGQDGRPGAALAAPAGPAPGCGDDRAEVPGEGPAPPLRRCRGAGRGPGPIPGRSADPGPADRGRGTRGSGSVAGRPWPCSPRPWRPSPSSGSSWSPGNGGARKPRPPRRPPPPSWRSGHASSRPRARPGSRSSRHWPCATRARWCAASRGWLAA